MITVPVVAMGEPYVSCPCSLTACLFFSTVALISGIILYILDATTGGGKMNMSAWARRRAEMEQKEQEEAAAK